MSSTPMPPGPPDQSGPTEYLESGAGRPLDPEPKAGGGGGRRKGLLIGGGVAALALVGAGAWAAVSFFATGAQPAEALPAGTLGYAAVDLDPSGGQKIEALRTLNKFPGFEDEVGIDTDDDIRKAIFDKVLEESPCKGLDYEDDVEPWLGDRAAVAAVDVGGNDPDAVVVLQVKDADKADQGLKKIAECDDEEEVGWSIDGDWAVLAETEKIADKVSDAAAKSSLADDKDFKKWTDEAGDSGVLTLYAGPALGDYLAENADDLFGFPLGMMTGLSTSDCAASTIDDEGNVVEDECEPTISDSGPESSAASDELKKAFQDFQGMAGILRFDDGALEMEFATGNGGLGASIFGPQGKGDSGGQAVAALPEDTAAAYGIGFADGWLDDLIDFYGGYLGEGEIDDAIDEIETQTGLTIPDDVETLLGDSATISLGSGFDPDAFSESEDGSDIPVGVKVAGDPDEIEAVLDKLRDQAPPSDVGVLDSDSKGDTIVIGPNDDYRKKLLEDGDLGDNDVFKDVVREADDASTVLFVNVNEIEDAIADAIGESDDEEFLDNLKPVSGFGITGFIDDDVSHTVMRLTTD